MLKKNDDTKPRLDLIPPQPLFEVAKAFMTGSKKYSDYNWKEGTKWSRYYAATLRHLFAFWSGKDKDSESKLYHLAHAICNLLIILDYQLTGKGEDDRYKE